MTLSPTAPRLVAAPDAADRWLLAAATCFTAVVMFHGFDHLRRGVDAIDRDVLVAGISAMVFEVGVVVLICMRHRWAPLAAMLVGTGLALGYVVVHFLPARDWLSDSLASAPGANALSWVAASLEVAGATVLAIAGAAALGERGGIESMHEERAAQLPLRDGLLHPVALVMLVGNLVLLGVTLAQL